MTDRVETACEKGEVRYMTLAINDDGVCECNEDGTAKWIESSTSVTEDATNANVVVGCRTGSTDHRGRKSCNDEEVHQLPADYVFAENEVKTTWHSDIGSSNWVKVSWEDRAEVAPGSGYKLARRMRVKAHARSGHGTGERGHTHATVECRFFRRST